MERSNVNYGSLKFNEPKKIIDYLGLDNKNCHLKISFEKEKNG